MTQTLQMKCRACGCLITQAEADLGAEIIGEGYETMCSECAFAIRDVEAEKEASE